MTDLHPFPPIRPAIKIAESNEKIGRIDCPELQWWAAIPALGKRSMRATYEADTLELSAVTEMAATSLASVHQLDCVEIAVQDWAIRADWYVPGRPLLFYAQLDTDQTRWLGVVQMMGDRKELRTFRDGLFEADWGQGEKRRISDDGRYRRQPDGSYRTTDGRGLGAGTYDLTIGARAFRCLRVLDTFASPPNEHGELIEAFIEPGGRTVFIRQYLGRHWGKGQTDWAEKYPDNARLVIDGCVYVHCNCTGRAHDDIANTALGVAL